MLHPSCINPAAYLPPRQVSNLIKYHATATLYTTPDELAAARTLTALNGKTLRVSGS
jgi:hypothetical protein